MGETSRQEQPVPERPSCPLVSIKINLQPQGRPQPMCKHIMKKRNLLFQDLSFEQCVAIGYLVRLQDFMRIIKNGTSDSKTIVAQVAQGALNHLKNDISKAWLVFLRSQDSDFYELVLLEAAFYFANRPTASVKFQSLCEKLLNAPRRLLRKPEETVILPTAESATVSELQTFLGSFLCTALKRGRQRQEEIASNVLSLTRTVELKFGSREGEDFILLISVASFAQRIIEDALQGSPDDLRDVVGVWLFDAMKASRAGEGSITDCVQIFLHHNEEDVVLEFYIGFLQALSLVKDLFP